MASSSLSNSNCLAQDDSSSTSDGTCSANDPSSCENKDIALDDDASDANNDEDNDCQDEHQKCFDWAQIGECDANPGYMLKGCRRSCLRCADQVEELARQIEAKKKKIRVWTNYELEVAADMGEEQLLENDTFNISVEQSTARIMAARDHIKNAGLSDDLTEFCKNKHESCTAWAVAGECEKNPKYMKKDCPAACMECHMLLIDNRCPIDPDAKPAWEPGSLNAMFERLIAEPIASKYPVTILSRDPWVVTLDDVVSEEEAKRLIELGDLEGYERSQDVGAKKPDGSYGSFVSSGRTSSNAWCTGDCYEDPLAVRVINRLTELTLINETNSEFLQLLRYEPGQFYEDHHDYIEHNRGRQQGVRILTSYLYLNDVEAGGGTMFTDLGITVMPKRGRALFWPSVQNDAPHEKDERTNHQALPVEKGIKYGANGWFHQYDFKTPYENNCSS